MILLSGGTDGGTIRHVVELAEFIGAADPRPRLGSSYKLPVVYAGNRDARDAVRGALADKVDLHITENLRPVLEMENLAPARDEIHELFLKHVMAQAPGDAILAMPAQSAAHLLMIVLIIGANVHVLAVRLVRKRKA